MDGCKVIRCFFLYGAKGMCVIRLKYSVIRNNKSNRLVLSFVQ
jgi:hypothetical protein